LPKANEQYAEKKFVEAEANYRISHSKFPKRTVAPFNLGNSIYKQNQAESGKSANWMEQIPAAALVYKAKRNLSIQLLGNNTNQ